MVSPPASAGLRVGGRTPRRAPAAAAPPAPAPPAAVSAGPGQRLEWLDALRGIAVLAVVIGHLTHLVFTELRQVVLTPWFDSGKYGVMVFFLVSGYIVPASLERHGSVRRFWTGRFFRLYPLLAVAAATYLLAGLAGLVSPPGAGGADPFTAVLAHLTLLQSLLGVEGLLNVLWTLSYEMVFYLLVTALFLAGARRRGGEIALALGLAAALLAPVVPAVAVATDVTTARVTVASAAVLLGLGITCAVRAGRGTRLAGAAVLGGLAVTLVLASQRGGVWEGLAILAVMFTGTAIYRAEHGEAGRARTLTLALSVWVLVLGTGVWNLRQWARATGTDEGPAQQSWTVAIVLTGVTFTAAWLLRDRRFPRALVWVGVVSYSVYLMHAVVLSVFHALFDAHRSDRPLAVQIGVAALYLVTAFTTAWATHRYVEVPGQRIGRRVARRFARSSTH